MNQDRILQTYTKLVEPHDGIALKGLKSRYTAVNGNMFSFIDTDGHLCLRLSEARKADFNAQTGGLDVVQHGAVMRGYVAVPADMLDDFDALSQWFAEAVAHARALRPKPTKRAKIMKP